MFPIRNSVNYQKLINELARGDLKTQTTDKNKKRHRANLNLLNGQQVVRMLYDSLRGTETEKDIHHIHRFWQLKMRDGDFKGFDRAWDFALDDISGWDFAEDPKLLRTLYSAQVRDHPLLKQHIANYSVMEESDKSYQWLRKTVTRVIDEQHILSNDRAWKERNDNHLKRCRRYSKRNISERNVYNYVQSWTLLYSKLWTETRRP